MEAASEPAEGSVRAKAPSRGQPGSQKRLRKRIFCSSVPASRMGVAARAVPPRMVPTAAQPQKISSSTSARVTALSTPPPP